MSELVKTPDYNDYDAAMDLVADEVRRNGGAWVAALRPEIIARTHFSEFTELTGLARISLMAKVTMEGGGVIDELPPVESARPFRYGMQMGIRVVKLLYDEQIDARNVVFGLIELAKTNEVDLSEPSDETAAVLEAIGEAGLEKLDDGGRAQVKKWAEEVGLEEDIKQRLYSLGFGAVILSAYALHNARIDGLSRRIVDRTDWEAELKALTTGE